MEVDENPTLSMGLSCQNLIDQVCDEFEKSWQRGETPDINFFLQETRPEIRPALLVELVRVDMEYLSSLGKTPTLEDYARRFPQFRLHLEGIQSSDAETIAELKQIGNLKLIEPIGTGTFGQVWKAWDSQLERHVAVKLPTEKSLSRQYAVEFRREAKAAAKLNHPGIVRVIGFGTENGIAHIVYDLVNGLNLKEWLKRNTTSPEKAASLCAKIADALSHAHQHGVFHRDLKPSNILVDAEGHPHITDFGLAKRADSTSSAGSGAIVGTLAYMGPEQAEGSGSIDGRADMYALGVILYEMLAGKPVFQGEPREMLQKILFASPPPISTQSTSIHPDLETICYKCLEKNRNDRYRTTADLADDLRRFIRGEPVHARPLSNWVYAWRWSKKRWHTIVAGLIVVMLFALVLSKPREERRSKPNEEQRQAGFVPPATEGKWKVLVTTNPPGAHVRVIPRRPDTGEPIYDRQFITLALTPISLELPESRYQVEVVLPNDLQRSHQVDRTVPPVGTTSPAGPGKSREFRVVANGALEWPVIEIPDRDVTDQMVYVEGTDAFPVGNRSDGLTMPIEPFYVSPHEFTYSDFLKLRPGSRGNVPGKPATEQPPNNTLSETWYMAEQWAEEAGGRLLTELEFEYLAVLAAKAELEYGHDPNDAESFNVAGGNMHDAIPTTPPICGILSGYSEWTSSSPNQTEIWPMMHFDNGSDYRIVRGGTASTRPGQYKRDPRQRSAVRYFEFHPSIGFRVARTANRRP